jgi:hypothetical protein
MKAVQKNCYDYHRKWTRSKIETHLEDLWAVIRKSRVTYNLQTLTKFFEYAHEDLWKHLCDTQEIQQYSHGDNVLRLAYHQLEIRLIKLDDQRHKIHEVAIKEQQQLEAKGICTEDQLTSLRMQHLKRADVLYARSKAAQRKFIRQLIKHFNDAPLHAQLTHEPFTYEFNLSDGGGDGLSSPFEIIPLFEHHATYSGQFFSILRKNHGIKYVKIGRH